MYCHSSSVAHSPSQRIPDRTLSRRSSLRHQVQTSQQQAAAPHQGGSQSPWLSPQRQPTTDSKRLSASVLRVGKFTEEWDASQRGSSIIDQDYRSRAVTMQRSDSVRSFAAGDDEQLVLRNNTLKKRSSVRRSSSLGRRSSRRSNRAGSVRSLALQSAFDPADAHSAFYCPIPSSGNPTEVLANRFQSE